MATKLVDAIFYEHTDRFGVTRQDWACDSEFGEKEIRDRDGTIIGSGEKEIGDIDGDSPEFNAQYDTALLRYNQATGNDYWC
jgi:hypothetical protein